MMKLKVDFNKIRTGILIPTAIGCAIILFGFLFRLVLLFIVDQVTEYVDQDMMNIINILISLASFAAFLGLFLWTGYRATRKYHADVTEAGVITAVTYTLIAVVDLFFTVVLIGMNAAEIGDASIISYGLGGEMSRILLEDTLGIAGIPCCALGLIPLGILINFIVGGAGGMLGEKK